MGGPAHDGACSPLKCGQGGYYLTLDWVEVDHTCVQVVVTLVKVFEMLCLCRPLLTAGSTRPRRLLGAAATRAGRGQPDTDLNNA